MSTRIIDLPKERRAATLFLDLTLVIFLIDALFVAINLYASNRTLERTLHSQSEELRSSYDLAVSLTYRNMMQLAMYIANDPEIQTLFLQGKRAIEAEGGGKSAGYATADAGGHWRNTPATTKW